MPNNNICLRIGKLLLVVMNVVIVACGLACIAIGTYYITEVSDNDWLAAMLKLVGFILLDNLIDVFMVLGFLLVISGILGCCGAIHHEKAMLLGYRAIVIVTVFLEIVIIVLALVSRNWARNQFEYVLKGTMDEYVGESDTSTFSVSWNLMQSAGGCCGATSYTDWADTDWAINGISNYSISGVYILRQWPVSCCINVTIDPNWNKGQYNLSQLEYDSCYVNSPKANYYDMYGDGCYQTVMSHVNTYTLLTAGLGLAVVAFQIIMFVCAMSIAYGEASRQQSSHSPQLRPTANLIKHEPDRSSISSSNTGTMNNETEFSTNL